MSEAAHDLLVGGADRGGLLYLLHRHSTAGPAVPPPRCQACREDAAPDLLSDLISASGTALIRGKDGSMDSDRLSDNAKPIQH